MIKLEGAIPALITPFTPDNQIDSEGFRRNIEFTVNGGVSAVVPCGTTGESATLSEKEHKPSNIDYAAINHDLDILWLYDTNGIHWFYGK